MSTGRSNVSRKMAGKMKEYTQGFGPNFTFIVEDPEPPADCQDCTKALDWCAEYKALNREDAPYNRGACRSYEGGRKGYKTPFQCDKCGIVYPSDKYFHQYRGEMLCCKHFGHEPGACIGEGNDTE